MSESPKTAEAAVAGAAPAYRNRFTLMGWMTLAGSLFSFMLFLVLDLLSPTGNPYVGILAYFIVPGIMIVGIILLMIGAVVRRRWVLRNAGGKPPPLLLVDLSQPQARRRLAYFGLGSVVFFGLLAIASYRSYHFSESTQFCGQACHEVMSPEFSTYSRGAHARISCSACHIGPGAEWYVKAKVSGLHQVLAVFRNSFERPIKTPIANLRPGQDTCEQCHWPEKFTGNLDRTYAHFLSDEANTPFSVRLSMQVGGSDPTHGPVGGIHWHMKVGNKIEYVATDAKRQVIPWVRVTDAQGVVTEYKTGDFKPEAGKGELRLLDCMDCHNRPAHIFQSPAKAVDLAMTLGRIDPTMPGVKKAALQVLNQTYANGEEARTKIATALNAKYEKDPRCKALIGEVQTIYRNNCFPEMKTDSKTHPNNLGHKEWRGCFRCHDGKHKTADGKRSLSASDCNTCHVILAQGKGEKLQQLSPRGQAFEHPGGSIEDTMCDECHGGNGP